MHTVANRSVPGQALRHVRAPLTAALALTLVLTTTPPAQASPFTSYSPQIGLARTNISQMQNSLRTTNSTISGINRTGSDLAFRHQTMSNRLAFNGQDTARQQLDRQHQQAQMDLTHQRNMAEYRRDQLDRRLRFEQMRLAQLQQQHARAAVGTVAVVGQDDSDESERVKELRREDERRREAKRQRRERAREDDRSRDEVRDGDASRERDGGGSDGGRSGSRDGDSSSGNDRSRDEVRDGDASRERDGGGSGSRDGDLSRDRKPSGGNDDGGERATQDDGPARDRDRPGRGALRCAERQGKPDPTCVPRRGAQEDMTADTGYVPASPVDGRRVGQPTVAVPARDTATLTAHVYTTLTGTDPSQEEMLAGTMALNVVPIGSYRWQLWSELVADIVESPAYQELDQTPEQIADDLVEALQLRPERHEEILNQLRSGTAPAEIARALGKDPSVHAAVMPPIAWVPVGAEMCEGHDLKKCGIV